MFAGDEVGTRHTGAAVNKESPENIDAFVYFEKERMRLSANVTVVTQQVEHQGNILTGTSPPGIGGKGPPVL